MMSLYQIIYMFQGIKNTCGDLIAKFLAFAAIYIGSWFLTITFLPYSLFRIVYKAFGGEPSEKMREWDEAHAIGVSLFVFGSLCAFAVSFIIYLNTGAFISNVLTLVMLHWFSVMNGFISQNFLGELE